MKEPAKQHDVPPSRRSFLKAGAWAGAALAGCATISQGTSANERPPNSGRLPIKVSGYPFDRLKGLVDGSVEIEGCDTTFVRSSIYEMNSNAMGGKQEREVTEIGLHPFMLAYANGGFRDYTLLPVFPLRVFRHRSMFIRTDRGIEKPQDLRGKTVATPGYSQSSLTWIRGILRHEYGVLPEDMNWVLTASSDKAKPSKYESRLPEGVPIRQGPAGKDESKLLASGEVDAVMVATEPKVYQDRHPKVARLFPDYRKVEREYFSRAGIFPIMHAVAIRSDVVKAHPWLPKAVFNAYSEGKRKMYAFMKEMAWAMISLPWVEQEFEDVRTLMGENYWPYGIAPNRKTLEALFRYSHEQGLASLELKIEELFHPSTLELVET